MIYCVPSVSARSQSCLSFSRTSLSLLWVVTGLSGVEPLTAVPDMEA